jgi:hypothetical protein
VSNKQYAIIIYQKIVFKKKLMNKKILVKKKVRCRKKHANNIVTKSLPYSSPLRNIEMEVTRSNSGTPPNFKIRAVYINNKCTKCHTSCI